MAEAKNKSARETKERVKEYTEEYTDIGQELTRLVRESYLESFQLGLSFWERNLQIFSKQVEQWMSAQEGYTRLIGTVTPWSGSSRSANGQSVSAQIEKIFSLQREYVDQLKNLSERGMQQVDRELREVKESV
jgi:hypothetical protein